jgi:cysteine desulfurase family protein (TIGR01976 family)
MSSFQEKYRQIIQRRSDFSSLKREVNGYPLAYFDGPGGTQIPRQVMETMNRYYETCNANAHGYFITTIESDRMIQETREEAAIFFNAEGQQTISFGANMTTLAYSLSKAIGRVLKPGDEILITQLDHEANRGPWLSLEELGAIVKEIRLNEDGKLDYSDLEKKINNRTRLVALGLASNALGTVNQIEQVRNLTKKIGAWLLADAVHFIPHFPIDVQALDLDFMLCSAYKFYGPHVGILYSRDGLLDQLPTDRLRTQHQEAPYRIETGTLNHAAIAGVKGAIDYISTFGEGTDLRSKLVAGMETIAEYEHELAKMLFYGLKEIDGITLYGPPIEDTPRAPTLSFTVEGKTPPEVCRLLDEKGILAWDGHFYAIRPVEVLGLLEKGGLTRVGISLYNTLEEVERLLDALQTISTK